MDNPRCTPPAISSHLSVGLVLLRLDPSAAPPDPRRSSRIRNLLPRLPSEETPHAGKEVAMEHNPQHPHSRCRKPLRRPQAPPPRSVRSTRCRLLHRLSSGGGQPRVVPVRPPRGLAQPSSPAKAAEHLVFLPYRGNTRLPRLAPPRSPLPPPAPPLFLLVRTPLPSHPCPAPLLPVQLPHHGAQPPDRREWRGAAWAWGRVGDASVVLIHLNGLRVEYPKPQGLFCKMCDDVRQKPNLLYYY